MSILKDWEFNDIFKRFVDNARISLKELEELSGVSEGTLKNWKDGTVGRPNRARWGDIVRIAAALRLNTSDTDLLLQSARHPSFSECQALLGNQTSTPNYLKIKEAIEEIQSYSDSTHIAKGSPQLIRPRDEREILKEAQSKLAELPLDHVPTIGTLPTGSRMPFSYNPLFVGREQQLLDLAAHLKGGETIAIGQVAAATGLGGIGKTQLATAFVHHYGQFFQGGVHWLSFADPQAVRTEIAACGAMMADMRADYATLDLETQVQQVLKAWQKPLPRLLVFDNCEDQTLVAKWRPATGGGRVLITSRRPAWKANLGVKVLALDILERQQSIELLRKFCPDLPASDASLDAIAEELGDLPLALHMAGSYLARYRHTVKPEQYLADLRQPDLLKHRSLITSDLSPPDDDLSPTKHIQHVARTFALSYDRLAKDNDTDVLALRLLAHIACFAPGVQIPRHLLLLTLLDDEEQALSHEDDLQVADALHRLTELGLVEEEADGHIVLHRLLEFFVRSVDQKNCTVSDRIVEEALLEEANRLNEKGDPQLLLLWQMHLRHRTNIAKIRLDEKSAELCIVLGLHLYTIGEYAASKTYYEQSLVIYKAMFGDQHPDTARTLSSIGYMFQKMGEYGAAQSYFEQALVIQQAVLGQEHSDTALSLSALGMLLLRMGEYEAAKSYLEQALAIERSMLGDQHFAITQYLNGWGAFLQNLSEDGADQTYYEDSVAKFKASLGRQHSAIAQTLNNLGILRYNMREYEAAKPYLEEALAIRQAVLGNQHPDTALSFNNLGDLLKAMGEYVAAKPYLEQTLAIRQAVLGNQHPDTALSFNNLGDLLKAMGEYVAAKPYYERALAIRQAVLGDQHPDTALSFNNLGLLLDDMGEYVAAKPYYERALAIRQAVLGEQHPDTATSLNNLGYLLQAMGEYVAAKPYYERALAIKQVVLGEQHSNTATSLNNLGMLLKAMGECAAAKPYLEQALTINKEVLGEQHPGTATSLNNLGLLLQAMGEYAVAKPYLERALAINKEVLGEQHPSTATSLNNLGLLLQAMGEYAVAKPYLEQALAINKEVLGEQHPSTALSLNNLGLLLDDMGEYAVAKPYYERALAIRQVVLGEQHPDTATSLNNLGLLLKAMGECAAARPYLEQALTIVEKRLGPSHPSTQIVRNNLAALMEQWEERA